MPLMRIPMCHRTSSKPEPLAGQAGPTNGRAGPPNGQAGPPDGMVRAGMRAPYLRTQVARLPMSLEKKALAPQPTDKGTGTAAVMRGSYRRTQDALLSPPGTPLAATMPLVPAPPGSGSGSGGGGGYRTPRRSQRYIVLPGSTGPEPLVLVNYASPAAANEELTLALAQEMQTGSQRPGLREPHRPDPLQHQFDDVPSSSSSSNGGSTGGGGGGSSAGRAVLVAKGSQMAYLAAHVLSNIGEGLRLGGERDGPGGGDARQYRQGWRDQESRITVVYSTLGEVRSINVSPPAQGQGGGSELQRRPQPQPLREWAAESVGLVFRPCKYDKDTGPPVDSRALGKKRKPTAIITCTHYLRVRKRPGDGIGGEPADSRPGTPGSGGWGDLALGGNNGYNGHRWEHLVQRLAAAELREVTDVTAAERQPLHQPGRRGKFKATGRAAEAGPALSSPPHPSAAAVVVTPSAADVSHRLSQHPPSQLIVAVNRTNHLQLKKQVRWIICVD